MASLDANVFCRFVLRDEKRNEIKQELIHELIQNHIDYCINNNLFCLILAPWGHGKTVQVSIGRVAFEIGKNNNIRINLISNSDANANKRIQAVGDLIKSQQYKQVFPCIRPTLRWAKTNITVKRDIVVADPTLAGYGIFSSGTGNRCDLLILDDPIDMNNTIINGALRSKAIEVFKNVWQPRVESFGNIIAIMTVWHEEDLAHYLWRLNTFCTLVIKVNENMSALNYEITNHKGNYPALG